MKNSILKADETSTVFIGDKAGDSTSIVNSVIYGRVKKSKILIDIRGGKRHLIQGNKLEVSSRIAPINVTPPAEANIRDNKVINK